MQLWSKNWTLWRWVVVIVVLVIFFISDDIVMMYLMSKLDFVSYQSSWYWIFYFGLLVGSLLLALVAFEALRQQPTTGSEGLIHATGRVVRVDADGYQVKVMGEIWQADSDQPLKMDDVIVVESMSGLRLKVRKMETLK